VFCTFRRRFNPEKIVVEGCCDATWIQLNIHLFEFTGDAKYLNEAEIALINSAYGHQHSDGIEWCYYTKPNEVTTTYVKLIFIVVVQVNPEG
jgi:DUF1680 family protein